MGGDEQPAGGAGHRKADALEHMGGFADTETHGGLRRSHREIKPTPVCGTAV